MSFKTESERSYNEYFNSVLNKGPTILKEYIHYLFTIDGIAVTTAANYYRDLILLFKYILLSRGKEFDFTDLKVEEDYEKIVEILAPEIHEVFIHSIRREDIHSFLFHLANDNKNSNIARNRRLAAIRNFFHYAETELQIIDFNPAVNIKPARKESKIPKFLTLDEAHALLAAVPPSENYARDYCIITFFLNLGLRISELVKINLQDFSDNKLRIYGKGAKERIVTMNDACVHAYQLFLDKRMSSYLVKKEYRDALFVSEQGRRLSSKRVYDIVMQCLSLAGLGNLGYTPHTLRHTAASLMYQSGVDIETIRVILGHTNISVTQIYTHTNNQMVSEATQKNPLASIFKEVNQNERHS